MTESDSCGHAEEEEPRGYPNKAYRVAEIMIAWKRAAGDGTVLDGWADVFNVHGSRIASSNGHRRQVCHLLESLEWTIRELRDSVTSSDFLEKKLVDVALKKCQNLVIRDLHESWKGVASQLQEHEVQYVRMFAAHLHSLDPSEVTYRESEIHSLLTQVAELVESVLGSKLPRALKRRLAVQLEDVRVSILNFRLDPELFTDATEGLIGCMVVQRPTLEEAEGGTFEKLRAFAGHCLSLASKVNTVISLGKGARDLLT